MSSANAEVGPSRKCQRAETGEESAGVHQESGQGSEATRAVADHVAELVRGQECTHQFLEQNVSGLNRLLYDICGCLDAVVNEMVVSHREKERHSDILEHLLRRLAGEE